MKENKYRFNNVISQDSTSSQGYRKIIYNNQWINPVNNGLYLSSLSKGTDIFVKVIPEVNRITNRDLKRRLLILINVFTEILSKIQTITNYLPPMNMELEEDSIFLEWIFKDIRVGFTLDKEESESMWFMITNRNLEEFSVTGNLGIEDYRSVIAKILKYILENT
jgi:hypothetical protein